MEAVKYGPTGDGGYNTPYSTTVFYRESNIFQVAVAALSEQCQAIPLVPGGELSLGDACEHPSPRLILFADGGYTAEHFRAYFKRGFQKIHVFSDEELPEQSIMDAVDAEDASDTKDTTDPVNAKDTVDTKKTKDTDDTVNAKDTVNATPADSPATSKSAEPAKSQPHRRGIDYICEYAKLDNRVTVFTLSTLNEGHLSLIPNLSTVYIMELVTCAVYPAHKSFIRTITHSRGCDLINYLNYTYPTATERGAKLLSLAVQFNGYECAEKLCERWQGILEERAIIARGVVSKSPVVEDTLYLYDNGNRNELLSAALGAPVKYIVFWHWDGNVVKSAIVKGAKWTEGDKEPADVVRKHPGHSV